MSDKSNGHCGTGKTDVRILTFKRWNLPQTSSITDLAQTEIQCGDYVSFQNYHFIDVSKVETESGDVQLARAYEKVQEIRSEHHQLQRKKQGVQGAEEVAPDAPDMYIQQCMVLLGSSETFWKEKTQQLLITMLQVADSSLDLDQLEENIGEIFSNHDVSEHQWALYYSLDFCDLVIFTRDIPFQTYHDILWDISPIHKSNLSCVRDTITVFAIEYTYLKKEFSAALKREGKPVAIKDGDEKFSVSLSLSVQAVSTWNKLCKVLEAFPVKIFRTYGRFDVCVLAEDVTFPQMLDIICAVDQLCLGEVNLVFGGYEVAIFDPWPKQSPLLGTDALIDLRLFQATKSALDCLYSQYSDALDHINERNWGYAAELKRSLLALLKNGFADEFAISVLLSFAEYLRFVTQNADRIQRSLTDGDSGNLFYIFQRKYFQALNMLMHCTMHSEKQFIQAPSLNATLCDIPPKLLACYAGLAYLITDLLNDEKDTVYSFQIVPDFQPEIYVKQISFVDNCKSKISIIYLNERLFYNPTDLIAVMCHEIAHYVGNKPRKREERAKLIFSSIGVFLLFNAVPFLEDESDLVDMLGNAFGEELFDYYVQVCREHGDGNPYFLDDVRKFIEEHELLLTIGEMPSFLLRLQRRWQSVMCSYDVRPLLEKMDYTLYSTYLSGLYEEELYQTAGVEILSRNIIFKLQKMFRDWICDINADQYKRYRNYYMSVIGAFRESYSDLRMVQLLHIEDDRKYEEILSRNSEYRLKGRKDFQSCLRHDAVCEALGMSDATAQLPGWMDNKDLTMRLVTQSVKKNLVQYLMACIEINYDCQDIKVLFDKLEAPIPIELVKTVRKMILDYRNKLCKYCDKMTSGSDIQTLH